ncbi:metalloproteinase inhibitor 3-like [Trichomycterus rosablanca]|uniref:metalloproteinase inhibitor 3-like n=1 Tax=Trichomycterus rosablanca TaxID=2290929 RepID=UPI002F355568
MMGVKVEPLVLILLALWITEPEVEGCMCLRSHFQRRFCYADLVFRAKIIEEKMVPWSSFERIQYKIKLIKMFKGFDKVDDIQYVYTPPYDSLCGVKLNTKNNAEYLLSGRMRDGETVEVLLCGIVVPWDQLSSAQTESLKFRYQKGCECTISRCYSSSCSAPSESECMWTSDPYRDQTSQHVCMRGVSGSCQWFTDTHDPHENDVIQESETSGNRESSAGGSGDGENTDKNLMSEFNTRVHFNQKLRKRSNKMYFHGKVGFI